MTSVEDRLAALEEAVARLESVRSDQAERTGRLKPASATDGAEATPAAAKGGSRKPASGEPDDRTWVLAGLERRHPEGAVVFAGSAPTPDGSVEWQWGRLSEELIEHDWEPAAARIEALGHPVRLRLLQRVLTGTTTTAALAETDGLGTTGQLHHHLRTLIASGWLRSTARGRYSIPPERVIPLLAIISAA